MGIAALRTDRLIHRASVCIGYHGHMALNRGRDSRIFDAAESGGSITIHMYDHTASCAAVKSELFPS